MKIKNFTDKITLKIIHGMIQDPTVCARIASVWDKTGLFNDPDCNLIAGWCVKFIRKYGEPPGPSRIDEMFDDWAGSKRISNERAILVDRKLTVIGDYIREREPINPEYLLDNAQRIFNQTKLKGAWDTAESEMDGGDVDKSISIMQSVGKIDLTNSVIKPAQDFTAWREAFDDEQDRPLITYPGKLNRFLGSAMCKGRLIAFMAPDKSFKSQMLLDAVFRAVKAKQRVVLFEAGDMTQKQVMVRIGTRSARRPRYPGRYAVPRAVSSRGVVTVDRRVAEGPLRIGEAYRAFQRLSGKPDVFRLSCHSNSTLSLEAVQAILGNWQREGWKPSIVCIDYADILRAPLGVRETNDQIDEIWKGLRRLSQDWDCLVLTATQSNAAAYKRDGTLRRFHFSGRKTKLAHVDGMIGINVTDVWRERGVLGLNWIVRRDSQFSENEMVIAAGCMDYCSPIIVVEE